EALGAPSGDQRHAEGRLAGSRGTGDPDAPGVADMRLDFGEEGLEPCPAVLDNGHGARYRRDLTLEQAVQQGVVRHPLKLTVMGLWSTRTGPEGGSRVSVREVPGRPIPAAARSHRHRSMS